MIRLRLWFLCGAIYNWAEDALLLLPIRSLRRWIYARRVREDEKALKWIGTRDAAEMEGFERSAREELEHSREQLAKYQ